MQEPTGRRQEREKPGIEASQGSSEIARTTSWHGHPAPAPRRKSIPNTSLVCTVPRTGGLNRRLRLTRFPSLSTLGDPHGRHQEDRREHVPRELARTFFNASLAPCHGLLRFMAQMRQTQAGLLEEMDKALDTALRRSQAAADVQELVQLQSELATDNLARTAQAASALFNSWLDTESQLLEQAQAQGADLTRKLVDEAPALPRNSNGADAAPALALLGNAQAAWTQMTQQWVDAVKNGAGAALH
jgi:hypothetical protein